MEGLIPVDKMIKAINGMILATDRKNDKWAYDMLFEIKSILEQQQKEIERLKKYEISHAELQLFAGYCLNDLFENSGSMCEEWKSFIKRTRDRVLELQDI